MNPIEVGLYQLLINDATVSGFVGTRVYGNRVAQNVARPYIVYQRIATMRDDNLKGSCGLVKCILQITAWSEDSLEAKQIGNAIRLATLNVCGQTWGDFPVNGGKVVEEADLEDTVSEVKGTLGLFGYRIDYQVIYNDESADS